MNDNIPANENNGTQMRTFNSPDNVIKPLNLSKYSDFVKQNKNQQTHDIQNTTNNNPYDYENVNHPDHYNNYSKEVIDMMEAIWGTENLITFCEMNAFKYRMRMGTKPDNPIQQDLNKEQWYLNKANELKSHYDDDKPNH